MFTSTLAITLISLKTFNTPQSAEELGINQLKSTISAYKDKLSVAGKILWSVEGGQDKGKVSTVFQYVRPNRAYVRQNQGFGSKKESLLVCDGKLVVFTQNSALAQMNDTKYVFEPVKNPRTKKLLELESIYTIGQVGFLDRNIALDIIFDRDDNFIHLNGILADVKKEESKMVNGKNCSIVTARMRVNYNAEANIPIQFAFDEKNLLVQIQTKESFNVGNKTESFMMTWDIETRVNDESAIDEKLFTLPVPDKG